MMSSVAKMFVDSKFDYSPFIMDSKETIANITQNLKHAAMEHGGE